MLDQEVETRKNQMKLTMLGTGNALATECYNTCFLLDDDGKYFMVDGGGGNTILRQLKAVGCNWTDVKDIFVTHKHTDHIMGIIWMIRIFSQFIDEGMYAGEANIYAHDEVVSILRDTAKRLLRKKDIRFIDNRVHLIEVHDGETRKIAGHEVTFFDIHSTKAKQFGFMMDIGSGRKLTCCGDEPFAECEREYAAGSDWLMHEAFCLHSQADIFNPYEKQHSTVKDAAEVAERLKVKNLLLYHTEDRNLKRRKELYADEAGKYFRGGIYVPDDLESFEL